MRCSESGLKLRGQPNGEPISGTVHGTYSASFFNGQDNGSSKDKDYYPTACSGRGDCLNGTCLCEIRYAGDECSAFNLPYYAGISSVFYFVALVSLVQLFICIVAEYQRLKQPSLLRACRVTTQKMLYFMVFVAASIRGAYFTTPVSLNQALHFIFYLNFLLLNKFLLIFQLDSQPLWAVTLMSAYYPLLMTCASLIVCMWAEVFSNL